MAHFDISRPMLRILWTDHRMRSILIERGSWMLAPRRRGVPPSSLHCIFDPGPPQRRCGTRWQFSGDPVEVVLFPSSDERPTCDVQLDPSGLCVGL